MTWSSIFVVISAILRVAYLQNSTPSSSIGSCTITEAELGRRDTASTEGLVSAALDVNDAGRAQVQILNATLVCQTSGQTRDTVGSVSFVVQYMNCQTQPCVNLTEQFQFDCAVGVSGQAQFSPPNKAGGPIRTPDLRGATLNTMLNDRCGDCSEVPINGIPTDMVTHCVGT
jgi:hypothetical protein